MRCGLLLIVALAVLAMPGTAVAQGTGGMSAPTSSGGAEYGQVAVSPPSERPAPLVVRSFHITPDSIASNGAVRFSFRVTGGAPVVRVRIQLVRRGDDAPAHTLSLRRRTGRTSSRVVDFRGRRLAPGIYRATLQVVDADAARTRLRARAASTSTLLRVSPPPPPPPVPAPAPLAPAPSPPPPAVAGGVFPVQGPFTFGGDLSRYGVARGERLHRGQDVAAAEGTPLVASRAGVVHWRAYQATGAGHYVVIRGIDRRDYVFMHMRQASPLAPGTPVAAGVRIGEVGSTGGSTGPHLHFEIWPDGWYSSSASQPIDPLPELRAWAGL